MVKAIALSVFLLATPAFAQQASLVIDRDLWDLLSTSIADLSMPLKAHQQAQQLMANVERESVRRAAEKAAKEKPKEP